jgi:SAM-dependent methyltransferase
MAPRPETEIRTQAVPRCPVCGGSGRVRHTGLSDRLHGVPGIWSQRSCSRCGAAWLDPRPIDDDLVLCYPTAYFTHAAPDLADPRGVGWRRHVRGLVLSSDRFGYPFSGGVRSGWAEALARVPAIRTRATHRLSVLFPAWARNGRLLDVGCGSGEFLAIMRGFGWKVAGVEVDPAAASAARAGFGLTVWDTLREAVELGGGFDVMTMSHVLEHVPDPRAFLVQAAEALVSGGQLLAVTPNAESAGHRIFGADWFPLEVPRHLVIFAPRALRRLAGSVPNFSDVEVGTESRIARKIARDARDVRRTGRFRSGVRSPFESEYQAAFAALERTWSVVAPVGEELTLKATKR